jgi:hypothetical protein
MPSVIDTTPALQPGRTFTKRTLIDLVQKRTNKYAREAKLDMTSEYLTALQELCSRHKWYWRRKSIRYQTVAGTPTYDLTALIDTDGPSLQEIIKCKLLDPSSGKLVTLPPIFGFDTQEAAMEDTTVDQPTNYFIDPGTAWTIRLTPIPKAIYTMRTSAWCVPVSVPEKTPDVIPLLPGHMHWILALTLEKNVLRIAVGEEANQYTVASAAYETAVARASTLTRFGEEERDDEQIGGGWTNDDCAIRSF